MNKVSANDYSISEKYLTIGLRVVNGTTVRFASVKVPIHELAMNEHLMDALDAAWRRELNRRWSLLEEEPLF